MNQFTAAALQREAVIGRYRGRRRRRRTPSLAYDLTIIAFVWSISAYPVLWLATRVVAPLITGE